MQAYLRLVRKILTREFFSRTLTKPLLPRLEEGEGSSSQTKEDKKGEKQKVFVPKEEFDSI